MLLVVTARPPLIGLRYIIACTSGFADDVTLLYHGATTLYFEEVRQVAVQVGRQTTLCRRTAFGRVRQNVAPGRKPVVYDCFRFGRVPSKYFYTTQFVLSYRS